jgi:acetyl esterase/lipase
MHRLMMRGSKHIKLFFLIIFFILSLAAIGFTIWPITGLYGSRLDWWGGNSAIQATSIAVFCAPAGTIGLVVTVHFLFKKQVVVRAIQMGAIAAGIILTGLCLPYFLIPIQVGQKASQEFGITWGNDWQNRVRAPTSGPWLASPYSIGIYYTGLSIDKSTFKKSLDVPFMTIGSDTFKFDVFQPIGEGPFPVVICIHGGGWCGLDKDTMMGYQREYLAAAGYVVFSVQYGAAAERGMSRQYSMQEIMDNLAHFSDWLATPANAAEYKADLSHCFVNGLSAGGHLSALVSVARYNVSAWNPAVNLIGGVDFYGITDIRTWDKITPTWLNASGLFNETVLSNFTIVDRFSPVTYVQSVAGDHNHIVPLLIFHGDVDSVVDVDQSRQLNSLYDARGLKCVYIEIPRGEHVFEGKSREAGAQISLWAMERFFQLCLE